jgi:hypothetical protein
VSERRYTEEELALILNRAAERQEGVSPSAPRYTLAEIQEIAAGAGIAPQHVTSVAATIRDARAQRRGGVLGAPQSFRFEDSIEGEVGDDVVGELLDIARRELGVQGTVSEALGSVEWKGRDAFGTSFVSITRRGGRTIVGVMSARTDAAAATATLGGLGVLAASIAAGAALVGIVGVAGPIAAAAGIAGGGGSAVMLARAAWRRIARRWVARTDALGSALVVAARRAVDEGPTAR